VKSKPFIVGLLVAMVVAAAVSIYLSATADRVDKSVTAFLSPDGRYKAVRVSLAHGGTAPFCFQSISIFLAVYPDSFAENEKAYQVYAAPCATPPKPTDAPAIEWLANNAVRITYSPAPAGLDQDKLRRRVIDASKFVHVSYVARK
jgi:hypothetical protein